jgi:hypothetical protein
MLEGEVVFATVDGAQWGTDLGSSRFVDQGEVPAHPATTKPATAKPRMIGDRPMPDSRDERNTRRRGGESYWKRRRDASRVHN